MIQPACYDPAGLAVERSILIMALPKRVERRSGCGSSQAPSKQMRCGEWRRKRKGPDGGQAACRRNACAHMSGITLPLRPPRN
jgi:hypothetical protein